MMDLLDSEKKEIQQRIKENHITSGCTRMCASDDDLSFV